MAAKIWKPKLGEPHGALKPNKTRSKDWKIRIMHLRMQTDRRLPNLKFSRSSHNCSIKHGACVEEDCKLCSLHNKSQFTSRLSPCLLSMLNQSQVDAISASLLKMNCNHKSSVELIWGPPGTGKTKTISVLLFSLVRMNCRTLVCAPTNVAIHEVASKVLELVDKSSGAESCQGVSFCNLGDVLLFGNKDQLKVDSSTEKICLDYRIERLAEVLGPVTGWRHCFHSMICFLEDCVSQYHVFIENELIKAKEHSSEDQVTAEESKSFIEFVRNRFESTAASLRRCIFVFCTHLPRSFIGEPAQLKECETAIPLQLPGLRHAVLVGDELQLPAMVNSNVAIEVGFGRSLFKRLSLLGHFKHLLNIQYRMHPSISFFPNSNFYCNRILDAPNVQSTSYERHYLPDQMFGPYSFINIVGGREELDDVGCSRRNIVEVSIIAKIVQKVYRACIGREKKLSIGVISPYAAQVVAIQDKLGQRYEDIVGFSVKEDIIILSTVRSNVGGSIGFLSSRQRMNVALTRARHSLWILGDAKTLATSDLTCQMLVQDSINRQCFFCADEDKDLAKAILDVKKELDQMDLLNEDSILFKSRRWKVSFSDNFRKSFGKLASVRTKKSVMNLLLKLSIGWRPKKINVDSVCERSQQIIKQFKVEGRFVICTVDLVKEKESYIQVLKVWDLLPLEEIPKLKKRLDGIFALYTDDFISHCTDKCLEGNLEVPKSWATSFDIEKYKELGNSASGIESSGRAADGRNYVENSKVNESLLLMKFYPLTSGVVNYLLSGGDGRDLDLPFEVTEEQLGMILCHRSSFILGRSGTGKTTVLTMKLFQKEQQHQIALNGSHGAEAGTSKDVNECMVENRSVLRQLFLTVSPKLCYAVKQHVSELKRHYLNLSRQLRTAIDMEYKYCFSLVQYFLQKNNLDIDMDDEDQFKDIADSFIDIPPGKFPLVITFHKFLMMLDGTLGNSYFKRFLGAGELSQCTSRCSRSVALETFIRTKEVSYDRFCSLYWPRFNSRHTKKLDPSRVFTEIISHIKGGMCLRGANRNKLTREDYFLMSEDRVSTLSRKNREIIYDIFCDYEKKKMEKGEFDLSDLVNDLHERLGNEGFRGDEVDFVYIDEVQDLTMRQIALFKYICRNVDEGFVFSGDTAQTIARGIDFRFQDIRSLFYNEFVMKCRGDSSAGRKEKGHISETLSLKQNFRTHDGVLKLAQSVIDLIYRFFPNSIDVLNPEKSLIYGEAPVLLKSKNDEDAIITIFGNSRNVSKSIVGFGAEQVILVRDDCARKEISDYIGKQALVLTILECKGLEFQDVLLYNFFGSSPLRNQWRVIYQYMQEQDLLDLDVSSPSFNQARHNVLCSELKQLYVAITRTRQRLWICEKTEEFCNPLFEYWKKKCLVQVRQLDDSLAKAMQVASSPEEWRARGIKLFHEKNFKMAAMCFERAGDETWEKRAKASGLRASAGLVRSSNPEMACTILRKAAEIFYSIGRAKSAAECFCDGGEYERAGQIYVECGEREVRKAGECFTLAACYERAAEVYANGNFFSDCLSVCTKGKLFDMGLHYIQYWKQHAPRDNAMAKRSEETEKFEQEFLESCAYNYYELKDNQSMMKFVSGFHSVDSKRKFLKSLGCLDELLMVEEESGNFLEAAGIAKLLGNLLLEADLLDRAGHFKKATALVLRYVFCNSLWSSRSKGWPLKSFPRKEELLEKAKFFAKKESDFLLEYVCTEANILSDEWSDLSHLKQYLDVSQRSRSFRGEILSIRKILDIHLHSSPSKYQWEDELAEDLINHSEKIILLNQVSVGTLTCFWNLWKEKVEIVFEYLTSLDNQDSGYSGYVADFCFNYFGVRKQLNNLKISYLSLCSDAEWVREIDSRSLQKSGKFVSVEARLFASVALNHWRSELLSVGLNVLETLEALHKLSIRNSLSLFHQSMPLIHIFEITKFLMGSKCGGCRYHDNQRLQKFLKMPTGHFENVFPLDWKKSLAENMIFLRGTELSQNLLEEVILVNLDAKDKLTHGQIGRIVMTCLGSKMLSDELSKEIAKKFSLNSPWRDFIEDFSGNRESEILHECSGYLLTTKTSFVEWFICEQSTANRSCCLENCTRSDMSEAFDFVCWIIHQFLVNKKDTEEWIKRSCNYNDYYPILVLRLVMNMCLLCVKSRKYFDALFDLLNRSYITSCLPREFVNALRRWRRRSYNLNVKVLAEAFAKIGNPLVIMGFGENCLKFVCPAAIFVDMRVTQCREDIIRMLFPKNTTSHNQAGTALKDASCMPVNEQTSYPDETGKISKPPPTNVTCSADQDSNKQSGNEDRQLDSGLFWHISDIMKTLDNIGDGNEINFIFNTSKIKAEVKNGINLISAALSGSFDMKPCNGEDGILLAEAKCMLNELKQLSSAMDSSDQEVGKNIATIKELLRCLYSRRPRLENFLNQISNLNDEIAESKLAETSDTPEKEGNNNEVEENGNTHGGALAASGSQDNIHKQKGVESKRGKGKNKGKKGKKTKGGPKI
ncbi:RNA helicase [Bertholletia excelsa]